LLDSQDLLNSADEISVLMYVSSLYQGKKTKAIIIL